MLSITPTGKWFYFVEGPEFLPAVGLGCGSFATGKWFHFIHLLYSHHCALGIAHHLLCLPIAQLASATVLDAYPAVSLQFSLVLSLSMIMENMLVSFDDVT